MTDLKESETSGKAGGLNGALLEVIGARLRLPGNSGGFLQKPW